MPSIKYVGVDLCKRELMADLSAEAKPRAFPNDAAGITAFIAALPAGAHVVCESTGGYERGFAQVLYDRQIPVNIVQPGRVHYFARSKGKRAKNDRIDAKLLTAFGETMALAAPPPPTAQAQELQDLFRARQQLTAQLNEQASHDEHVRLPFLAAQAKERRELLQKQIQAIEKRIRTMIAADRQLRQRAERVQQVQGIGEVSAWTVLAEMPELGSLRPGQAGYLLGVVPHPDESGPRSGQRHIGGGRAHARKVLYMAALTASQHNPVLAPFYRRLTQAKHKPHLVALGAVMRKLVELLNRLLHDPNFVLAS